MRYPGKTFTTLAAFLDVTASAQRQSGAATGQQVIEFGELWPDYFHEYKSADRTTPCAAAPGFIVGRFGNRADQLVFYLDANQIALPIKW
ncbi:hypothetical protein N8198_08490 [Gammaproteobacteria bacterium]|nr:hypothetical protein [Gammaproteobacteria bacterium]